MSEHGSSGEHNPFQSPPKVARDWREVPDGVDRRLYANAGRVRQVRPVAICLIIHGVLIALVGGGLTFAAIFLATSGKEFFPEDQIEFSTFQGPMIWGYGIIGGCLLVLGLMSIIAGVRNLSFRGRTLGIVSMSLGVATAMGVWCAPTAIGLAIWGLIVYLDPSVKRAFELVSEGAKPKEILSMVRKQGT